MSAQSPPKPSKKAWLDHKPILKKLWLDGNIKLEGKGGVIDSMKTEHNFSAR